MHPCVQSVFPTTKATRDTRAGFDFKLPDDLIKVEKVGQFRRLVDMSESSNELKSRVRALLCLDERGIELQPSLAAPTHFFRPHSSPGQL